jgi:hypothetical protein
MRIKLVLLLIACSGIGMAQGTWYQKANFGGAARTQSVGFSIGTKGYIGTGASTSGSYHKDFWEWDQATNVWTQKADFDSVARYSAVGFSIGTKGYVGTGWSGSVHLNDFWEYNPGTNTWIKKANVGGAGRAYAVGFSIGNKGYIGTGVTGGGQQLNDFWEYDPAMDAWTQKNNFSGSARYSAVGFSIGTKGYIGTGQTGSVNGYNQDFWEWDPATNIWTQKTNFGGMGRKDAVGFSIGAKGYIGTGWTGLNQSDFWEYSPSSNAWTQKTNFPGTTRSGAVSFSIGNKGYVGTGGSNNDVWEFDPNCMLTSITASSSQVCAGGNVSLNVLFNPANTASYNWTPSSGLNNSTISNPIATLSTATTFTVIVMDAVTTCSVTAKVTVDVFHTNMSSSQSSICNGQSINICASGGLNYSWSTGQTTNCIIVNPSVTTTYSVTALSSSGCQAFGTTMVSVINCSGNSLCNNQDFETGTFKNWTGLSGSRQNPSTPAIITWIGGLNFQGNDVPPSSEAQHTMITKNKLDSLCIDPTTNKLDTLMTTLAPGRGSYSIRLGNDILRFVLGDAVSGAEKLQLSFTPTLTDSIFEYMFACVFASLVPQHNYFEWPAFVVNVHDQGNTIIPNLTDTVYAENLNDHFITSAASSQNGQPILYKRWSNVILNFSKYIGQNITIDFINLDCVRGGHFGYTYLDVSCNDIFTQVNNNVLNNEISVYPNPTTGLIDIFCRENISEIFVTDIVGRNVFVSANRNEKTINLSLAPAGIYFLNVKTENGPNTYKDVVKKIVKE